MRFAEIPEPSRHRYAGDRFCYMEAGRVDLPAVLLLHGIGANSLHWRYQLAGLADRFRLIAWNAPGYLLSDNLRAESPSGHDYADALDELLSALGIDGFDIVANSFGTRVAQCFAYHRLGRIGRAVFTGTSIPRAMSPEERARSIEARARMIERGGYGFGDRAVALLGSAATTDTLALVQQTLRATNPAGFMQSARFIAEAEMPPLGAGLTMPLLMVQGQEDGVAPCRTRIAERMVETRAELPFIGEQVGLFRAQPGRPNGRHDVAPRGALLRPT